MFDINAGKGKPGKPSTPSKASKEPEKPVEKDEKQEEKAVQEEPAVQDNAANNNNVSAVEEDELIIKDELDNDCFEEVDRIGEIEKEVKIEISIKPSWKKPQHKFQDEVSEPPKPKVVEDEIKADDNIEISTNDNEESLNLTIGEEEEQLLHDEVNDVKPKGESIT
mgnify:CR=1 FL=1